MNTALLIGGFAMLSAGVSILALVRAYEGVVLAHVTIDPEGDPVAPSSTAPGVSAPSKAVLSAALPPKRRPALRRAADGPPEGYTRTVTPCGHPAKSMVNWGHRRACSTCGAIWDPASRNQLEIASDGFLRLHSSAVEGYRWTKPHGDY